LFVEGIRPTPSSGPGVDDSDGGNYSGHIPYAGGSVIAQPRVVVVLWGNHIDATVVTKIVNFYLALVHGSFMHFVSEYSIIGTPVGAYGSAVGPYIITPSHTGTLLQDTDVSSELSRQIAGGALPAPDANTVYMVHFPPGVLIEDPNFLTSCIDYCAYHSSSGSIIYAVLPDFTSTYACAPGPPGCNTSGLCCGDKSAFENLTKSASHELMEAITDPAPLTNAAWQSPRAEIGDPCSFGTLGDASYTTVVDEEGDSYQAQKGFSNAAYAASTSSPRQGCVDYPTTMCCNMPSAPIACSWLPNGATSCVLNPGDDAVVSIPTVGGFGSATAFLSGGFPQTSSGVCFPFFLAGTGPDFCIGVQATGVVQSGPTTVTVPASLASATEYPNVESCYVSASGRCQAGTTSLEGCCMGPLVPFAVTGDTASVQTNIVWPSAGTAIPAAPHSKLLLLAGALLASIAGLAGRKDGKKDVGSPSRG
jgi:hypothetical protein